MNFKSQRIKKNRSQLPKKIKEFREKNQRKFLKVGLKTLVIVVIILTIPLLAIAGFKKFIVQNPLITGTVLTTVGKALPTDSNGYTNFLLLGTGDAGHEGKNLTDTIIVASFNPKTKYAILTSIPRDLFIKTPDYYGQKINSVFTAAMIATEDEVGSYQVLANATEQVTGKHIHRIVRIDFSTFERIVDLLGGVTINVKEPIYDPSYPGPNYSYQTFRLAAGLQNLDGSTALKYARSRHSTSDFDRSRRQQDIILAIKEKAASIGILSSPSKVKALFEEVKSGIYTDLDSREIIELAGTALKFDRTKLISLQLHDDQYQKGGFLYTPPKEQYGSFVLLPVNNNYNLIHKYLDLHYLHSDSMQTLKSLQILNGTNVPNLATSAKIALQRFGFQTSRYGNANTKDVPQTTLYNKNPGIISPYPEGLKYLFDFTESTTVPPEYIAPPILSEADYVLELGGNFAEELKTFDY